VAFFQIALDFLLNGVTWEIIDEILRGAFLWQKVID